MVIRTVTTLLLLEVQRRELKEGKVLMKEVEFQKSYVMNFYPRVKNNNC
jgi:hypothetical protein